MSHRAVTWARAQKPGAVWLKEQRPEGTVRRRVSSWARKQVLFVLADYADDDGRCFVGVARLARDCSMSVRTLHRVLATLVADGYVRRVRRGTARTAVTLLSLSTAPH